MMIKIIFVRLPEGMKVLFFDFALVHASNNNKFYRDKYLLTMVVF